MKIEKISENQIKFILSQLDLSERGIKLTELVTSSEKTHGLLREMMEAAMTELNFETDGAPLMIEAMPLSTENVMIIVTKISDTEDFENKLNLLPKFFDKTNATPEPTTLDESNYILIYEFENLDDVSSVCEILDVTRLDESYLYKKQNIYYLILESQNQPLDINYLEPLLSEYGIKHISTEISKYHIFEHGEPIIKSFAVNILGSLA